VAAAAALAVAAVAIGHLLHDYHVRIAGRRAQADGLVVALRAADVGEVGGIVRQLRALRSLVVERLGAMARPDSPEADNARRNAVLALLPYDPSQVEGVTMAVVPVAKPLEFEIGSPEDEDDRDSDERIHAVRLDRSFAIATREVTLAQFPLLAKYAWFLLNGAKRSHPVGLLKPNDLGLFDMLGNAFEWTEDRYTCDSVGTNAGSARAGAKIEAPSQDVEVVLRGGSFSGPATSLRSAYRERSAPSDPLATYGFRYVRTLRSAHENEARAP
jgi:formylglycine-generating enzyme required for sulfatase activity